MGSTHQRSQAQETILQREWAGHHRLLRLQKTGCTPWNPDFKKLVALLWFGYQQEQGQLGVHSEDNNCWTPPTFETSKNWSHSLTTLIWISTRARSTGCTLGGQWSPRKVPTVFSTLYLGQAASYIGSQWHPAVYHDNMVNKRELTKIKNKTSRVSVSNNSHHPHKIHSSNLCGEWITSFKRSCKHSGL